VKTDEKEYRAQAMLESPPPPEAVLLQEFFARPIHSNNYLDNRAGWFFDDSID
jgi:hypothetical protein